MDKRVFEELARGQVKADGFTLNGIWVPFYSTHKLMAGLRDAAHLTKLPLALELERNLADYLLDKLRNLTPGQAQDMLQCEHGAMSDVWCDLAADTGDQAYLDAALRYFHHNADLDPLYAGEDKLDGHHANTLVTKVLGLTRCYELTGDEKFRRAVEFFHRRWVEHRAYSCGGVGDNESFFPEGEEDKHLTGRTVETCNSYNFLKIEEHLWQWNPSAAVADFSERVILNHIAANIGRKGGEFGYFMALGSIAMKAFSEPLRAWWCCVGTGIENPQRFTNLTGAVDAESRALYLNWFWEAHCQIPEFGLGLEISGGYPRTPKCRLTFTLASPEEFTLFLRIPSWCAEFSVAFNSLPTACIRESNGYAKLKNRWITNDRLEIDFHTEIRTETLKNHSDFLCFMYGPLLLGGGVPADPDKPNPSSQRYVDHAKTQGRAEGFAPVLVLGAEANPVGALAPLNQPAVFRSSGAIRPDDLKFQPLMDFYEEHYAVYFRRLTPEKWLQSEETLRREEFVRAEQERKVVDRVAPDSTSQRRIMPCATRTQIPIFSLENHAGLPR